MSDASSRFFGLILIVVAVWIGTYWLWEPRSARSAQTDALARLTPDAPLPSSENSALPEPPRANLAPLPVMTPGTNTAATPTAATSVIVEPAPADPAKPAPLGSPLTRRVQKLVKPEFRDYVVQKGDVSWKSIAARKEVYGDPKLAEVVSKSNPLVTSDRLKPGVTKLRIAIDPTNIQGKLVWVDEPVSPPVASEHTPSTPATKTEPVHEEKKVTRYTIKAEDTLWSIAKKFYGKGNDWKRIYEANTDVIPHPDRPAKGVTIIIPDADPPDEHSGND